VAYRSGTGHFFSWNGGCLFIGRHENPLPVHRHQAIQLVVANEGHHEGRASEAEPWRSYSILAIPSNHTHSIDVTAAEFGAVIFVEPETREGRAITQRFLMGGLAEVGDDATRAVTNAIFDQWLAGKGDGTVAECRRLVQVLAAGVEPAQMTDERIIRATDFINSHLDRALTLDEVAGVACLSPSRFRHLFAEQVGMGLRPYILWRRFILVWDLLMKGGTLSAAAHAAGFADSAHLSRTSVKAFGFAPSGITLTSAPPSALKGKQRR
jgi:AraC-like DNA-binding protein